VTERTHPETNEIELHPLFFDLLKHSYCGTFIAEFRRCRIKGGWVPAVLSSDGRVIFDLSREYWVTDPKALSIFKYRSLPEPRLLSGTSLCLATLGASNNYSHWLFDLLPRIEIANQAGWPLSKFDHVIVNSVEEPFQIETLKDMGAHEEQIVQSDKEMHLQCEAAVIPSYPGQHISVPKWSCRFLRQALPMEIDDEGSKRVYISRRKAAHRRIINEEEIIDVLRPLGFVVHVLEDLPTSAQRKLFAEARIVVSPAGSSLANVVFCRPRATVVELHHRGYVNPDMWKICHSCDIRYLYALGDDGVGQKQRGDSPLKWDFELPITTLRSILEMAGI